MVDEDILQREPSCERLKITRERFFVRRPFSSACQAYYLRRAARATETNIVYAFSATTSINDAVGNYVGTVPANLIYFTNRAFTVRIFADTNAIYDLGSSGDGVDALAATIEVAGIGTVDLDTGYRITLFINRTVRAMGTSQPVGDNFDLTLSAATIGPGGLAPAFRPGRSYCVGRGHESIGTSSGDPVVRCLFSPHHSRHAFHDGGGSAVDSASDAASESTSFDWETVEQFSIARAPADVAVRHSARQPSRRALGPISLDARPRGQAGFPSPTRRCRIRPRFIACNSIE